jgi:hypothetical protein
VFLPYNRSGRKITNKDYLQEAIMNFEEFWSMLGKINGDISKKIRYDENVVLHIYSFKTVL